MCHCILEQECKSHLVSKESIDSITDIKESDIIKVRTKSLSMIVGLHTYFMNKILFMIFRKRKLVQKISVFILG